MKNYMLQIFVLSLFLLSLVNVDAAPTPPYIVTGDVRLEDGSCVSGFNIKAKAFSPTFGTLREALVGVNENCEYSFSLGGEGDYSVWYEKMPITLTFCDASKDSLCVKTIAIGQGGCEAGGGCIVNYNYKPGDYTVEGKPIVEYVEKIVEVVKYRCQDGTEVSNLNECLETDTQVINYIVGGLGGIAVTYGLFKFAQLMRGKTRKGKRAIARKSVDTYIRKRKK